MAKRLRDILPESLFAPRVKSQKTSWNSHHSHHQNTVQDHQRSDKPNAYDRAGNPRSVYSGSTKSYNRKSNRHGYDSGDDSDAYDLGKSAGVNDTQIGLKRSALPVVTVREMKEHLTNADLAEGQMISDAVAYLRGIEDEAERNEVAEHFCRMFENTDTEFSRSMFFQLVNFEDDAE